jgi:ubiquitin-conjugating enzyme E2 Z
MSSIILSKETVKRILADVKDIMKNPLTENGIYYLHDDEDLLKGYALIIGPEGTPYFGGNYFFELKYSPDYPHSPPSVLYCTNGDGIRFNPNLYTSGKVCISILNTWRGEQWTSCQTISTVLLTLCTLLCENPLLNEPGITIGHEDMKKYTSIIEYRNIDIAVKKMVEMNLNYYPAKFQPFYPTVKEEFLKRKDALAKFLSEKATENADPEIICTHMYNMRVLINYPQLLDEFTKLVIDL